MANSARIDELRKKFEENPRRYFAPLANEYRKAGDIEQAIAICREYLPQQPGHMSGHIVYGQALYEARQFEESRTVFETALALDPENLIALRHLGDIALIVGDTEGARSWYRRVLDADPRNEEIQAQLATLDQAAPVPPAAGTPTPSSAPTVVVSARSADAVTPAMGAPVVPAASADSPTAEVALDAVPPSLSTSPTLETKLSIPSEPVAATPLIEKSGSDVSFAQGSGAPRLDLDSTVPGVVAGAVAGMPSPSFNLEGLETTSLSSEPPPVPTPPADVDTAAHGDASAPTVEIPVGSPVSSEPPPIPVASGSPAPSEPPPIPVPAPELIDLDARKTSETPVVAEPASAPASTTADLPMIDLGEVAAPPDRSSATATPQTSAPEEAGPAMVPDAGPFVTETMAELYLKQGHRDEALRVFQALATQRPDDAALQSRIASLEAELGHSAAPRSPSPGPPAPSVALPAAAARQNGPSIRDVLRVLALRKPGQRPEMPGTNGAGPVAAAEPPRLTPEPARDVIEPPTAAAPESAAPSVARTDALGTLFGSRIPAAPDEDAALALSQAFVETNGGGAHPAGAPARPASDELSLDHVFRAEGASAAPSSFSFDQFFSARGASQPPAADAAPKAADDVAHFTQWLQGLKQR